MAKLGDSVSLQFAPQYRGRLIPRHVYTGEVVSVWKRDGSPVSVVRIVDQEGTSHHITISPDGVPEGDWVFPAVVYDCPLCGSNAEVLRLGDHEVRCKCGTTFPG